MTAYYLAIGGDLEPTKRSYFREAWNEKSWWLPWHQDARTRQWLRTEVNGSPSPMPTPYRTLEDAEQKRGELAARYVVYIVNASTHQRFDSERRARSIPAAVPVLAEPSGAALLDSMDADERWYALHDGWVR